MIAAIPGKGTNQARATCDGCGREEVVVCDYTRESRAKAWRLNDGQINRKLAGQGWALVKGRQYCPDCAAGRKHRNDQESTMKSASSVVVAPNREPSREEKRQIMELLGACYDPAAGRYKGGDTDQIVAQTIGGGVMPGWVAAIREEFFGPDGGNGEMDALLDEMREWVAARERDKQDVRTHLAAAESVLRACDEGIAQVAQFSCRLEAIRKAVGPKAGR